MFKKDNGERDYQMKVKYDPNLIKKKPPTDPAVVKHVCSCRVHALRYRFSFTTKALLDSLEEVIRGYNPIPRRCLCCGVDRREMLSYAISRDWTVLQMLSRRQAERVLPTAECPFADSDNCPCATCNPLEE